MLFFFIAQPPSVKYLFLRKTQQQQNWTWTAGCLYCTDCGDENGFILSSCSAVELLGSPETSSQLLGSCSFTHLSRECNSFKRNFIQTDIDCCGAQYPQQQSWCCAAFCYKNLNNILTCNESLPINLTTVSVHVIGDIFYSKWHTAWVSMIGWMNVNVLPGRFVLVCAEMLQICFFYWEHATSNLLL